MELVLYYSTGDARMKKQEMMMKSVLVRMGVKIRNVAPDQVLESVGYLAGVPDLKSGKYQKTLETEEKLPEITEPMLVMRDFTSRRIDTLLLNLRKAKVPKINLKAIVTEQNAGWSFYHLYEEIGEEHRLMNGGAQYGKSHQAEAIRRTGPGGVMYPHFISGQK